MQKITLAFVVVGLLCSRAAQAQTWELVQDEDGIKVWTREVKGGSILEIKAQTVIELPAKRIWDVICDVQKYIEFMPYIQDLRIVGTHENGIYLYQRIDPPLVSERDYALKVVIEPDEGRGVYKRSWSPANDRAPEKNPDVVRVEINTGNWTITSMSPNSTKVVYYLYTDPGGSLPAWMVNKANKTSVPSLLSAVTKRSHDPTWTR
ncbi:MAG: hypothetical protein A2289_04465 [Deltaproteobacteria bacterium RIFOXYA12_FULL_58_15]|nr:MAG: hypothetical protein A2289_04465 [Deltaproteobacteria bacterium RIFOXYA12_FULL_58_15]OGR08789.1 MAG: hypothetical protein A2341_10250 [Deltaproteobacteria bacterium RIFOXYB12_FULL_58_9]